MELKFQISLEYVVKLVKLSKIKIPALSNIQTQIMPKNLRKYPVKAKKTLTKFYRTLPANFTVLTVPAIFHEI